MIKNQDEFGICCLSRITLVAVVVDNMLLFSWIHFDLENFKKKKKKKTLISVFYSLFPSLLMFLWSVLMPLFLFHLNCITSQSHVQNEWKALAVLSYKIKTVNEK